MTNPLRIGPMPPDEFSAAASGSRIDARALIKAGDIAYPAELRAAMQRVRDDEVSEQLDLAALSAEFGVKVVAAGVYGRAQEPRTLVYLYEADSGRTARWFAPWSDEALGSSPLGEPWPGYSEQSVSEVVAHLDEVGDVPADQVRAYETAHKNRKGVLDRIEER